MSDIPKRAFFNALFYHLYIGGTHMEHKNAISLSRLCGTVAQAIGVSAPKQAAEIGRAHV